MSIRNKILLVEDDPNFGKILKSYLELAEYTVTLKEDGKKGLSCFKTSPFDLCILDIMLPEMDGYTLAKEIKKINSNIPLIFLTAKTLKEDVLEGFRIGAYDYLTKPIDSKILLAKIAAILKRNNGEHEIDAELTEFTLGEIHFNYRLRKLQHNEVTHHLSPKEAELLRMMCTAKDGILSRRDALLQIWEADNYFTTRSMDVFIVRLRKYLRSYPKIEIINIHGNGFRLVIHP